MKKNNKNNNNWILKNKLIMMKLVILDYLNKIKILSYSKTNKSKVTVGVKQKIFNKFFNQK